MILPDEKVFNKWPTFSDDEIQTHTLALFHAINFIREVGVKQ